MDQVLISPIELNLTNSTSNLQQPINKKKSIILNKANMEIKFSKHLQL